MSVATSAQNERLRIVMLASQPKSPIIPNWTQLRLLLCIDTVNEAVVGLAEIGPAPGDCVLASYVVQGVQIEATVMPPSRSRILLKLTGQAELPLEPGPVLPPGGQGGMPAGLTLSPAFKAEVDLSTDYADGHVKYTWTNMAGRRCAEDQPIVLQL